MKKNKRYASKASNTKPNYSLMYFIKLYWHDSKKMVNILLMISLLTLSTLQVFSVVGINKWQNYFFDALQNYDAHKLILAFLFFALLLALNSTVIAFTSYFSGLISLKWRKQLTSHFSNSWLANHNYHKLQTRRKIDNPEQRISDDMANLPTLMLQVGIQVFMSLLTLVSFILILWKLSEQWVIKIAGVSYHCPGIYIYAILLYAIIFNVIIFIKGHNLIHLNYENQAFTANFRFNMSLIREHSDSVGLQKLEKYYSNKLTNNFAKVFLNCLNILRLDRLISLIRNIYIDGSMFCAQILALPSYFIGHLSIGYMMQLGTAAMSLNFAFAVLVTSYESIARLRAAHLRVSELESELRGLTDAAKEKEIVLHDSPIVNLSDAALMTSEGQLLMNIDTLTLTPGKNHLILGNNHAAKLSLLRSLTGHGYHLTGTLTLPKSFNYSFIGENIFLPRDRLLNILYLDSQSKPNKEIAAQALQAVDLSYLIPQLSESKIWQKLLSSSEKQQLALGQAIVKKPDYLFVDATHLLNDDTLADIFTRVLRNNFTQTTVVVIANRIQNQSLFDIVMDVDDKWVDSCGNRA